MEREIGNWVSRRVGRPNGGGDRTWAGWEVGGGEGAGGRDGEGAEGGCGEGAEGGGGEGAEGGGGEGAERGSGEGAERGGGEVVGGREGTG